MISKKSQHERIKNSEAAMNKKITDLDNKFMLLEKHDCKYNLLIYGVKEENNEDVIETMKKIFTDDMGIGESRVDDMYFAHAHRVPSRGKGPKPIILRCTSFADRELILSKAKNLLGSKRTILVDLPEPMKKERNRLAKIAYDIRKSELVHTRIKETGLDLYLEVRKDENHSWVKREV